MIYVSEQELVDEFVASLDSLSSPFGEVKSAEQFFYSRGCTDVIAVDASGEVIAFEAKLAKWRIALNQAYRNTCFANRSYIILPEKAANNAVQHSDDFDRRNVGICFVSLGEVTVLHEANHVKPLQPWLNEKAVRATQEEMIVDAES